MWEVIDNIVGENTFLKSYFDALEEAERRVQIHETSFNYKYRGHHNAIKCDIKEELENKKIIILPKEIDVKNG